VNALRHVILNISLTYPYDFIHERLWIIFGDYGHVTPISLICAALIGSAFTLPIDNVRTRIMQLHNQADRNRYNYRSGTEAFMRSILHEGHFFSPWMGFYTYFLGNLIYATVTIGICDYTTRTIKQGKNL
jgi:hypothetical protein